MTDNQRTNLAKTIVKLYYTHWALFWRIMLPVAIVAIVWHILQIFQLTAQLEEHVSGAPSLPNPRVYTVVSGISTAYGTQADFSTNLNTDTSSSPRLQWQLYLIPYFGITNNERITWKWEPNFLGLPNTPLILLLLTLSPLSLAIARIASGTQINDSTPLAAREVWRCVGRKALTVFAAFLLFTLIVDVGNYLYLIISWLMHSQAWTFPFEFEFMLFLQIVPHIYFLVMLSLYNPCLILEDNSILGIFRRSHTLVSGARLRFFGLYLLTSWIASVITSVLLGAALFVFSIFIPDLAQMRVALFPLKFLLLFIGGDIEVVLPQLLSTPLTIAILVVKGLVVTFIVPIWGILTTYLYLERSGVKPDPTTDN